MNTIKKALLGLAVCAGLAPAEAQVTGVQYGIKYNTSTCRYDIYMKATGSATTQAQRQASTAQLTIVVNHGLSVGTPNIPFETITTSSIFSNEPKLGGIVSGNFVRGSATNWTNKNVAIQRGTLTNYDAYAFVPDVSNAYYPVINSGDTVVLFSLAVPTSACGNDIRLWNNNVIQGQTVTSGPTDPTSANYLGDDYNNGMGIGSSGQIYTSNAGLIAPPKPTVSANRTFANNTITLTSTATANSACATGPLEYVWTGPDNFFSVKQNPDPITPVTAAKFGTYSVQVTNSLGCATNLALSSIALPVRISKFEGSTAKCAAVLNWTTASETGFSRFDVEYSNDGEKFMTVGEVESKKQATGSSYSYTYAQPSGKGFYRLKAIDLSGLYSYSEIVKIQTNCGAIAADIIIAPNPTSGNVSIRGIAAGTEIRIMDMLGKVVANEVSNGAAITVNLGNYANGLYNVLVAQNGAWEKVGQIVKN